MADNNISFKDWVSLTYRDKHPEYLDNQILFMQQIEWITDTDGTILVNFIGRFENLEADFKTVCEKINIPYSLPHLNSTEHEHYKSYYDNQSRFIIANYFKDDIRIFKYTF